MSLARNERLTNYYPWRIEFILDTPNEPAAWLDNSGFQTLAGAMAYWREHIRGGLRARRYRLRHAQTQQIIVLS